MQLSSQDTNLLGGKSQVSCKEVASFRIVTQVRTPVRVWSSPVCALYRHAQKSSSLSLSLLVE